MFGIRAGPRSLETWSVGLRGKISWQSESKRETLYDEGLAGVVVALLGELF